MLLATAWTGAGCRRTVGIVCWDAAYFYGASRPEANNVNGKKVFIVGGGNSAGQAAMFLSSYAAEVKVLVRGEGLKVTMSQYLIGEMRRRPISRYFRLPRSLRSRAKSIWNEL